MLRSNFFVWHKIPSLNSAFLGFLVISRNLWHITISKKPRAVRRVLSRRYFFCDAPHLTTSAKKSHLSAPCSHLLKISFFVGSVAWYKIPSLKRTFLRTISNNRRAVRRVLSRRYFFCVAPHLTTSAKKWHLSAPCSFFLTVLQFTSLKSISLLDW